MAEYKVIDGVLYKSVDTTGLHSQIDKVINEIQPYKDGIKQCEDQITQYNNQINTIIANSGLDKEVVKAVAPDKANLLGF